LKNIFESLVRRRKGDFLGSLERLRDCDKMFRANF
jgi:hypothetical protein